MTNYKNGKIYRLVGEGGIQYVGSTTQPLAKRKSLHKSGWKQGKTCRSVILFEKGEVCIVLLENYPCETKEQLLARERYWIETIEGGCVNKITPGLTEEEKKNKKKEYYESNKDHLKEYKHEYYKANEEQEKTRSREWYKKNVHHAKERSHNYYEANKDQIKQRSSEYYQANKDRCKEYHKTYAQANKDRIREYKRKYTAKKKAQSQS